MNIDPSRFQPSPARVQEHVPPDSTPQEIDQALSELRAAADSWVDVSLADRRAILAELIRDFSAVAGEWAEICRQAEGIPAGRPQVGEEWLAGPYVVIRNLQLLDRSLAEMERNGNPKIPGKIGSRADGRVTAGVFPGSAYDKILFSGITAEVWMQPGVTRENLHETMAVAYKNPPKGKVSLVLGAGNVSSIGPMDVLYKLFVENQVVICKMHPVNAYLGPLMARSFQALVDWNVLRIVYGAVDVGSYLCEHDEVDEIHITGSDKTVEAIVFGPGEEGAKRKAEKKPRNTRPVSSELGNVSPVIVVPGPWSKADLAYHGQNIASMLANNGGFNCTSARVLIQHKSWDKRQALLDQVRTAFSEIPTRQAFYPGAADRYGDFLGAHPEAEQHGNPAEGELPWTLIPDVDVDNPGEIAVNTEAFCSVIAETALEAASVAEYVDRAVELCNDGIWGTLNVNILIHPASLGDAEVRKAYERALDNLRYGTIAVNCWASLGYGLVSTPWGAFPGHDIYDIQSGTGVVHNSLMFDRVEKAVVRAPFRMFPKPVWFAGHQTGLALGKQITAFEASPSVFKLPGLFWQALRG